MRLPLRHPPLGRDATLNRCSYLEELADSAVGLALGGAAATVAARGGRGRHGHALQWHLGLSPHDSVAEPDWEARIEIKLVSVWRNATGRLVCDKLKVCDYGVDPWRKLGNTMWVFADRMTRVVLAARQTRMAGVLRERLEDSWRLDPHFDRPDLFVEPRRSGDARSPAYYLSAAYLLEEIVPPSLRPCQFDPRWWSEIRGRHSGKDPRFTVVHGQRGASSVECAQCGRPISWDPERLAAAGWAPCEHIGGTGMRCHGRGEAVVDIDQIPYPAHGLREEQISILESRVPLRDLRRLADEVPEPDDHGH